MVDVVECPLCGKAVKEKDINAHLDSNCTSFLHEANAERVTPPTPAVHSFFTATQKRVPGQQSAQKSTGTVVVPASFRSPASPVEREEDAAKKRVRPDTPPPRDAGEAREAKDSQIDFLTSPAGTKRRKTGALAKVAPLAERMRPETLDEVYGQDLVGPNGIIRGMIEEGKIPSMILWGSPGTGKTTIARIIANTTGCRFVELNSANAGVADVKKVFKEARSDLQLMGRRTILFCDEIHRFSKSQQDVLLGPVEAGEVTLIGATTENPSFKVIDPLLSRCRTFTLSKLTDADILGILQQALSREQEAGAYNSDSHLLDDSMLKYLSSFSAGDARTALNLLELAMSLSTRPNMTPDILKTSLTQTLVYDTSGDQHYDSISALHKSLRGSDADAALYYLARMLQSGEDPLYIARRLVVVASEDIGLADNTMLPLAIATYTACEKIGMPECRINLAHCAVALALAPKSVRAYRGLNAAYAVLKEPGVAALSVPMHLRNAPTRLMREGGWGKGYKYNPDFVRGRVKQDYLPDSLRGTTFLKDDNLGDKVDSDLEEEGEDEKKLTFDEGDVNDGNNRKQDVKMEEGEDEDFLVPELDD
jgi:putative ATPase